MTYAALPSEVRLLAERVLTEKQLEVFNLEVAYPQWGLQRIADELDLTRSAVRDRIAHGHRNLRRAGVDQDASGRWYMSEEVAA